MDDNQIDIQLMMRIREGDRGAFETLYQRYRSRLFNYLFRQSWNRHTAEDCLQEVFYRIWRSAEDYRIEGKVSSYVFRIAHNYWINEGKKKKPSPFSSVRGAADDDTPESRVEGSEPLPDEELMRRELQKQVRQALEALPEHERDVVLLSELEGFKYEEISRILGIPEGTVKSRMFSAVRRLRERLKPYLQDGRGTLKNPGVPSP